MVLQQELERINSALSSANCLSSLTTFTDCGWGKALFSTSFHLYATYDSIFSSNNKTYQKLSDLSVFLNDNFDRMARVWDIHNNCTKYNTQTSEMQLLLNASYLWHWNRFSFEFKSKFIDKDMHHKPAWAISSTALRHSLCSKRAANSKKRKNKHEIKKLPHSNEGQMYKVRKTFM